VAGDDKPHEIGAPSLPDATGNAIKQPASSLEELQPALDALVMHDEPRNSARELVEAFFRGRNANTLRAYQKDLAVFAAFLKAPDSEAAARTLLSLTAGDAHACVLRFQSTMVEAKLTPATVNRRVATLRALTTLARMLGLITWSIELKPLRSTPYRDTMGPGEGVVAAMLARAEAREDVKGLRDAAIVHLLFDLGFRRGEVCSLDRSDYVPERGIALVKKGYREPEWSTLPDSTREALQRWLGARSDGYQPLFIALDGRNFGHRLTGSSVYEIIRVLGQGDARAHPHAMRHTAVSKVVREKGVVAAQKFARHKSVNTTMIYNDAIEDVGGKAAAHIALPVSPASAFVIRQVIACGHGHLHKEEGLGKLCLAGDCASEPDKSRRRIRRREMRGDQLK
jgi:integrase/recombinase XerC